MRWNYQALNRTGEELDGSLDGTREDILAFLKENQWELISAKADYAHSVKQVFNAQGLSSEVLAQFFSDTHNMFSTGMTIGEIISAQSETTTHAGLRQLLVKAGDLMAQGESFSKALAQDPSMPWIVHSTLYAGESSGKLNETVAVLGEYFKRRGDMKEKIIQATVYPAIVFVLLVAVMLFVSLYVVPKLQILLPSQALKNPATQSVLFLSKFLQNAGGICLAVFLFGGLGLYYWCKQQRQQLQLFLFQLPVAGDILKGSAFSFYFLNLSVLLNSGVPLVKALGDLHACMDNALSRKFLLCRDHVLGGASFWQSVAQDAFFPPVIAHTLRRGEESARISEYCENLTAYFTRRVNARVDGMVHLIQPLLLGLGGLFLVVIAFAFLVPIYGSLTQIAGGSN